MIGRDEQVELLAARLHEVKTGDPDSYSRLPSDEKRGWRSSARRVLRELIQAPEASRAHSAPTKDKGEPCEVLEQEKELCYGVGHTDGHECRDCAPEPEDQQ